MTDDKIAAIVAHFSPSLNDTDALALRQSLKTVPDANYSLIMATPVKSHVTTLILSIFLGGLGVDRFYVGDIGIGIAKLLLGWLTFGIWYIVDIFLCYKKAKQVNMKKLTMAIAGNA